MTAIAPLAAFPTLPDLNALMNLEAAGSPPIILVRDICSVRTEGRTKTTRYCDPPLVCDRANPGKCKPGPALQRQLDEERRQQEHAARAAQERLDRLRRELEAQRRNLLRQSRTTYFGRTDNLRADDRRASGCKQVIMFGNPAQICPGDAERGRLSSNAYDHRIIPSPQSGRPRPPQNRPVDRTVRPAAQVPAKSRPASLRFEVTMMMMARDLFSMAPDDPARAEQERRIITRAKEFADRGEDVAAPLARIMNQAAADAVERERTQGGSVPSATLPPQPAPETPIAPPQQATAPPPRPYTDNDEVLCSYLMTLAQDQRPEGGLTTRLGQRVPDYCQPYLRSLPRDDAQTAAPYYSPEAEREEAKQVAEQFRRDLLLPPDHAGSGETN